MITVLTLVSTLLSWVLYSSVGALVPALVVWLVLRWMERCNVVFNRVYLACLLWTMLSVALVVAVAAYEGHLHPPYGALLHSGLLRVAQVLNMLISAVLLWRLVPRTDAHRIRPGSACMAVAITTALAFGIATTLA